MRGLVLLLVVVSGLLVVQSRKNAPKVAGHIDPARGENNVIDKVVDSIMSLAVPRGIRNNNPLNIKEPKGGGDFWVGELDTDPDATFEEFVAPEYGYRAAKRVIDSYRRRGVKTLAAIISTFAPSSENLTFAYISSVSNRTGFAHDRVISDSDLPALFRAMAIHENGVAWAVHPSLSIDTINKGLALA